METTCLAPGNPSFIVATQLPHNTKEQSPEVAEPIH